MGTFIGNKVVRLKDTSLFSDANLVSYWTLDNTSNDQKGSNHGTNTDINWGPLGKFDKGVYFNGTSSKIVVGTSSSSPLRISPIRTYSFWFYTRDSNDLVFINTACAGGRGSGGIYANSDQVVFWWTPTNPESDTSYKNQSLGLSFNTWHHCVFSINFNGSGSAELYLDGRPYSLTRSGSVTDATPKTSYNSTSGDSFGAMYVNEWYYYSGYLDEVSIFSRALTSNEVLLLATGCQNKELYYSPFINSPNLVAYWRFSDASGKYTLTNFGSTTFSTGKFGNCSDFGTSNTSKYLKRSSTTGLPVGTSSRTLSCWFYPYSLPASNFSFFFGYGDELDSHQGSGFFGITSDSLVFDGYADSISALCKVPTNTWSHVAGTFDGTTAKLYFNGNFLVSGAVSWNTSTTFIQFGRYAGWYFSGMVDDAAIFDRVLSPREIKQLYQSNSSNIIANNSTNTEFYNTTLYSESAAYWRFEGNSNGTVGGINGTDTNMSYSVLYGVFGQGAKFNGTSSKIRFGTNFNYTSQPFSFSFWLYFNAWVSDNITQGAVILYKGPWGGTGYYLQAAKDSGTLYFVTNQSGVAQSTYTNVGLALNCWWHVVITRNGASVKIYINGEDKSVAGTHINPTSSSEEFQLGCYGGNFYFNGYIDDFAVFNKELTATEVLKIYNPRY